MFKLSNKWTSIVFRLVFLSSAIINYILFVFVIWGPQLIERTALSFFLLLIFNFLFGMVVWTTFVTATSDRKFKY
ncbi:MAG: hypothetical protein MJ252_28320 [archaeon]|nr:hypothetical protein [archaeon]